jgi:hypothetical protein
MPSGNGYVRPCQNLDITKSSTSSCTLTIPELDFVYQGWYAEIGVNVFRVGLPVTCANFFMVMLILGRVTGNSALKKSLPRLLPTDPGLLIMKVWDCQFES